MQTEFLLPLLDNHLVPVCCSASPPSLRATVHVRVNDVNEFSPVFVERRYEASVPEGRLFDRIVRVEALDADCSPQYSQICFYDIITPNVPFAIDNDGEIGFYPLVVDHHRGSINMCLSLPKKHFISAAVTALFPLFILSALSAVRARGKKIQYGAQYSPPTCGCPQYIGDAHTQTHIRL